MESTVNSPSWRVLLVEDDRDDYLVVRNMLAKSRQGEHVLEWASSYEAGVTAIRSGTYDAVLLDYFLGEQDGLAFLEEVHAKDCSFPFILITNHGSAEMDLDVFEADATFSITKNELQTSLLERSIRYAIDHRQLEERLKESEAAVRQKERRMSEILNSIQDGFFELDRSWRFSYINQRAAGNGQEWPENLVGKNIWEVFPYMVNSQYEVVYRRVMDTRIGECFEAKSLISDNWYSIHVYPSEAGISIFWTDITVRKQMETALIESRAALRESEKQAREQLAEIEAIYQNAPIGLCVFDDQLHWVRMNQRLAEINGVPLEDHIGKTPKEVVPDLGEQAEAALRIILETGEPLLDFEMRGTTAAQPGVERFWNERWAPMKDAEGKIIGISVAAEEITERKRAELALQQHDAELEAIFNAQKDAIIVSDNRGVPIRVNPAALPILGFNPLGKQPEEMLERVRFPEGAKSSVTLRALRGEASEDVEQVVQGRVYLASAAPMRDESSQVIGAVTVLKDITERKHAEAEREQLLDEIQRQKELLERLVQNAPVGIAILYGPEHRFKLVNSVQSNLFPTVKEFVGRTVSEVWPESTGVYLPLLDRVYQTGEPYYAVDAPWRTDKGQGLEETFFTFSYTPLYDSEGAIEGILVISVETTEQVRTRRRMEAELAERKRAEEALESAHADLVEESNRLLAVMEALPIGLAIYDMNGGVTLANTGLDAVWGSPRPPANSVADYDLYKAWWVKTGERVQPEEWASLLAVRKGETVTGQAMQIQRFDGTLGYILNSGAPVRDAQGQVVGAVVAIMDITDRVRAEKALQESERLLRISEEHFRVALKNSPILVYTTDTDLRYTWIYNPAFGFDPAQVEGKTDEELNDPEDVSELVALKRSVLESGTGKRQEIQLRYQGQVSWYDVTVEPLRDDQGEVTGLTVAAIDMTEQKQLEQARLNDQIQLELQRRLIEQREQERQQIARDIHDGPIQTLVSAIFNIQMAKETIIDRPLQIELNQIGLSVKNAVQELRDVVNELRPPSLLRFGLTRAVQIHAMDFQEKHTDLDLILDLEDDNRVLAKNPLGDQVSLTLFRIYQEALNNVVRHAAAKTARVRFKFEAGRAVLEISDDGKGFTAPPDLTRQTERGHYGLAGMKERSEAIHGEFQVRSQPGQGTTIRVVVPIGKEAQA